ncbi:MAG: hypothetical protein QM599_11030 [Pseudoxanthomonas sp.]
MKLVNYVIALVPVAAISVAAMVANYYLSDDHSVCFWLSGSPLSQSFPDFYAKNLRGSLFTGFLTLGGFLMSLKAFIVVNMKKEVFDSDAYKKAWAEVKASGTKPYETKFQPLRDLSNVIFLAVAFCISSAVTQLTIGLLPNLFSGLFALTLACIAIGFVLRTLWLIKRNLKVLFDYMDETDS